MDKPIDLIEKDLKYKEETLEALRETLKDEEKAALDTALEIQALKEEIEVFEKAMVLLKGGDKKHGK